MLDPPASGVIGIFRYNIALRSGPLLPDNPVQSVVLIGGGDAEAVGIACLAAAAPDALGYRATCSFRVKPSLHTLYILNCIC